MYRVSIISLTFIYFLLSGFTWVAGETGQGVAGRLTIADGIGLLIILLFIYQVIFLKKASFLLSKPLFFYLIFLTSLLVSASISAYPSRAALEMTILIFLFFISIALYNLWSHAQIRIELILRLCLIAGSIIAIVGLLEYFFFSAFFGGSVGGLSGTFRNTGQAGTFFSVFIAILLPAFLARKINPTILNFAMFALIVLALIFTFKRAALIGTLVGVLLVFLKLLFSNSLKDKKIAISGLIFLTIISPLAFYLFSWGFENVSGTEWRVLNKFNSNIVQSVIDEDGFFYENINLAVKALNLNPLFGVGLGNFAGIISEKYEVHSTYLGVLAYGGLIGFFIYASFIASWIWRLFKTPISSPNRYMVILMLIMIIGLMISFVYTYHLRKREFWILFTISLYISSNKNFQNIIRNDKRSNF